MRKHAESTALCPYQKTLKKPVEIEGRGIHTGRKCTLKLLPAPAGRGVVFVRTDLPGRPEVAAVFSNVLSTNRRTALAQGPATVETVEHLLACMTVMGIDNCLIEMDGPEVPALDGSSLPFYNLLVYAGLVELDAPARRIAPSAPANVQGAGAWIRVLPASTFSVRYHLNYPEIGVGHEVDFDVGPATFLREIAPARTFCLEKEIEELLRAGFGRGADKENTVVLGAKGARGNSRFADEPARHKVIDLLGDLFFLAGRFAGRIECECSGHALNRELVRVLLEMNAPRASDG